MLAPPLNVNEADIDEILERLADALRKFDVSPRVEAA
jgi:acetylornithine/succinyldiaminopimelate/putrescine aminotransferase